MKKKRPVYCLLSLTIIDVKFLPRIELDVFGFASDVPSFSNMNMLLACGVHSI